MPNYTVTERNCLANQRVASPAATVPPRVSKYSSIRVQLTSSEWAAKAGTGTLHFGIERSNDGGATWLPWVEVPAVGQPGIAIGWVGDEGELPSFAISSSELIAEVGCRVRLWANATTAIRLGASVEVV